MVHIYSAREQTELILIDNIIVIYLSRYKNYSTDNMITDDKQIDSCIEDICLQGCQVANQVIQALEEKQVIETVKHLSVIQRRILLQELKKIMAVYAETNSCAVKEPV